MVQTCVLDDSWVIAMDSSNCGRQDGWFKAPRQAAKPAFVPGIIQQTFPGYHGVAWYWLTFKRAGVPGAGERALLRFGAVDYLAEVWLNGQPIGGHEGGETPFELDATKAIKVGKNLLAVRAINPTHEPIDGVVLKQTPHRNKAIPHTCGSGFNYGGIVRPVELVIVPEVRITDIFSRPDLATGDVRVSVTVRNDSARPVGGTLDLAIGATLSGEASDNANLEFAFQPGDSTFSTKLRVNRPHAWSLEDPFLYRVTIRLTANWRGLSHERSVRCGFRDFRIIDGFFHLNGKRIFVKSSHTGNHFPVAQITPVDPDLMRRDLIMAKASGFNMLRWIAGMAWPEQLDFADEIGLMVYEEHLGGWCLEDSPEMARRYDLSTREMILRDRNHPSVAIWGMLNETPDGPVFRHAVKSLKLVRELDDTRLVLLNSGRWDWQHSIGSASNPGTKKWEHVWGAESPKPKPVEVHNPPQNAYVTGAGDVHHYPWVPQTQQTINFIRTLGAKTKPLFLSEYGFGSQMNVIQEFRQFQQAGWADAEDAALIESIAKRFEDDWRRFGMEDVYALPEDMLLHSQRMHCRQRLAGFDAIRSNPKICGYNLTGLLDHGITGEGLWTFWRRWKPGVADALSDGWAPLRWCLFATPMHGYIGRAITLEVVLANEDVLPPGRHPVRLRVNGPSGTVWHKDVTLRIPKPKADKMPPLAIPVWKDGVKIDGPTGRYSFAVEMDGAAPAGGRLDFFLTKPGEGVPAHQVPVALWGVDERHWPWMQALGIGAWSLFDEAPSRRREVILIGDLAKANATPGQWRALLKRIARGDTAIFLSPAAFARGDDSTYWLPLRQKGRCYDFRDWLYHKQNVAKRHPVFDGLPTGALDWDYYDQVIGRWLFEDIQTPDETIAATFALASHTSPTGYRSGVIMGEYKFGHGRFIVNSLEILANLNVNPAADRLLLNLIAHARQGAGRKVSALPADFEAMLKAAKLNV